MLATNDEALTFLEFLAALDQRPYRERGLIADYWLAREARRVLGLPQQASRPMAHRVGEETGLGGGAFRKRAVCLQCKWKGEWHWTYSAVDQDMKYHIDETS